MQASIIIATYNWPLALELCLQSLSAQLNQYPDIEVIIADDGSSKTTKQVVEKYQQTLPKLKHIWHEDMGFRKSLILNKAVAQAQGEYLMFLDGDCIPFPDYIKQQLNLAEIGYFVAGNRVLLSQQFTSQVMKLPNQTQEIMKWNAFKWLYSYLNKQTNKLLPWLRLANGKWRYSRQENWKYPKGCNFALWKNAFIAVNGFDEEFSGWGHEDADLFIRLLHYAIKIKDGRFAVPVLHLWHKESDRNLERSNYQRLMDRLKDKNFIKAISGIDKFL